MKKIFQFFIAIFILSFYLPGGYLLNFPVSNILIVTVLLLLFIHFLFTKNIKGITKVNFLSLISPLIALLIFYVVSLGSFYSIQASQQLNSFVVLLIVPFIFTMTIKNNIMRINEMIKYVLVGFFVKLSFRFIIEILFILGYFNHDSLNEFYLHFFSSTPVTLFLPGIDAMRIQFPSDALPLVVYSFILIDKTFSKRIKVLSIFSVGLFSLIVYSRVFIAQFIVITLISIILNSKKLSLKNFFFLYSVIILLSTVLISFLLFGNLDYTILLNRFTGSEVVVSDFIREQQYIFLKDAFLEKPIFGHGIGYFITGFIRSSNLLFSYELEYLSFLMQFGILGFVIIVGGSVLNFISLITWKNLYRKELIIVSINFLIWLLKPLFNPSFLTINSASIIVILILYSFYFSNRNSKKNDLKSEV